MLFKRHSLSFHSQKEIFCFKIIHEYYAGAKIWCQAPVIRYCIVHNLLKVHRYGLEFALMDQRFGMGGGNWIVETGALHQGSPKF